MPHLFVLPVSRALVTLCFTRRPIAYQTPDGQPVRILFSVITPTVSTHVELMSQLARALHDPAFKKCVLHKHPREAIFWEAWRLEQTEPAPTDRRPRVA